MHMILIDSSRRRLWLLVALAAAVLGSAFAARPAEARYVSPEFLGQHLMARPSLTPQIPVHDMRLWDSGTTWCQIDRGTASDRYNWSPLDAELGQAVRVGADVTYTFGYTPSYAVTGSYPQPSVSDQCAST